MSFTAMTTLAAINELQYDALGQVKKKDSGDREPLHHPIAPPFGRAGI